MVFVAISHMTGGGWGVVYRRFGEAAFLTLPWMLIVCLALALPGGYGHLFPWANLEQFKPGTPVTGDEDAYRVMTSRNAVLPWFTWGGFFIRQIAYFAIWGFLMWRLYAGSQQLDRGANPVLRRRLRKISAATVVLFFVTVTSYAMDYIMSRETNWYSSILGFVSAIEFGGSAIAGCSLVLCYFADKKPIRDYLSPQHLNDLGNIMLALTVLWQYTSFAQLLIQWNGNLADDIGYYVHRGMGAVPNNWRFVALSLFLGHFLVPFFLLLMKGLKRKAATFGRICGWILVMRVVETLWVVAPANNHVAHAWDTGKILWTDPVAFVGVGGVWLFLYFRALAAKPLLPQNATGPTGTDFAWSRTWTRARIARPRLLSTRSPARPRSHRRPPRLNTRRPSWPRRFVAGTSRRTSPSAGCSSSLERSSPRCWWCWSRSTGSWWPWWRTTGRTTRRGRRCQLSAARPTPRCSRRSSTGLRTRWTWS